MKTSIHMSTIKNNNIARSLFRLPLWTASHAITTLWLLYSFPAFSQEDTTRVMDTSHTKEERTIPKQKFPTGDRALETGDYDKAIQYYTKEIEANPNLPAPYKGRAKAYMKKNEYTSAIKDIEQFLQKDNSVPETYYLMGQAYEYQNEKEKAKKWYIKYYRKGADESMNAYLIGRFFFQEKSYLWAIRFYRTARELQPDFFEATHDLGSALLKQDRFDSAAYYYQEAIETDDSYPFAYHNLGTAYAIQKNWEEALSVYEKAAKKFPDSLLFHNEEAVALIELGNLTEAEKKINHVLIREEKNTFALLNRATLRMKEGRYEAAEAWLTTVLEEHPNLAEAYVNRGLALEKQEKFEAACKDFLQAKKMGLPQAKNYLRACQQFTKKKR